MRIKSSISEKLLGTLQKGKKQLGTEALGRVTGFVEKQRTGEEAFMDKSGKTDLYYTMFGCMLSYVLGIKLDPRKMNNYLSYHDPKKLDLVHYAAYVRCMMMCLLMDNKGSILRYFMSANYGFLRRALWSTKVGEPERFRALPHDDPQSPYAMFVSVSLLEDTGQRIKDTNGLVGALDNFRAPGGGYMNTRNGHAATTNATVAALAVRGQLGGYTPNEDLARLREAQMPEGGFKASEASPMPDMLSTATALFMLHCYNTKPKYQAYDFIEAHWLESGGFAATLLDNRSDAEYTFYGLLAIGATYN